MAIVSLLLRMTGALCMFLFGMKIMSDGIQKSTGDRMRKTLNFMTGNRFMGVLTGLTVTGIIQSSLAVTVMVVSFVNAGLLNLTQAIGVIMGANIGTTVTAWIVSLLGFSLNITKLALPAIGIGFILSVVKWKYKSAGEVIMGFGLLFMGLYYLTQEMSTINDFINFGALSAFKDMGFVGVLIGAGAGMVMTFLIHSSSASTAIFLTMAFNDIVTYEMAASMILGANIGTTFDAMLASIGAKTGAKRAALVHVLFNIIGTIWALPLLRPLLVIVDFITPGAPVGAGVTTHLAMLHTVFNSINTILFLPFVKQFASLVTFFIRDDGKEKESEHYVFASFSGAITGTPELKIVRAEKEIRDMAGLASAMYTRFCGVLLTMKDAENKTELVTALVEELKAKEEYADEMREVLTSFLMECTREQLNLRSERRVSRLLRIISNLEDMTDDCYSISLLLERGVKKDRILKGKEMRALIPYLSLVEDILNLVQNRLGRIMNAMEIERVKEIEENIIKSRKKLRKLGRRRIEAGEDLKTELLFIDLVRSIEKIGNYCFVIARVLTS